MATTSSCDLLFESARFNLSEPRDYFINDCCFGDDLAKWLVERLRERCLAATDPDQEDWGWYFDVRLDGDAYFVGVGGLGGEHEDPNRGEWRLIVEKHRTLWQKMTGANGLAADERILAILQEAMLSEPGVTFVGVE